MKKIIATVGAAVLLPLLTASGAQAAAAPATLPPSGAAACHTPAPTTAAGFQSLFDALPTWQWGGADGSLSVDMGHKVVWLYGDTLDASPPAGGVGRFVHSSAIVQHKGCLTVSHTGAQLLPDDPDGSFYWIDSARKVSHSKLKIRAAQMVRTGFGPWDWKATGLFKTALVHAGYSNLDFVRWVAEDHGQATQPSKLLDYQCALWIGFDRLVDTPDLCANGGDKPHEFHYQPRLHPEQHLSGGKALVTVSYNNDGPLTGVWLDYRPHFFAINSSDLS